MTILTTAELENILNEVEQRVEQIQHDGHRLVANARHWMVVLVPPPRRSAMQVMLDWIEEQMATVLTQVVEFVTQPGVPWTLNNHGAVWSGPAVGGLISAQVGKATLDEIHVDDWWSGKAADAYKNHVARQKEALTAVAGLTRDIQDVLTQMALAVGAYWIALLAMLIEFALIVSAAFAASSTGVGAPAGVAAVVAAIAKFAAGFLAIVGGFYAVVSTVVPKVKDLQQALNNNIPFPGGRWPRPGATLPTTAWQLNGG